MIKEKHKINYKDDDDGMLPEYNLAGKKFVRGKYYKAMQQGYTVRIQHEDGSITEKKYGPTITLEPDIAVYFPDSESVNNALRTLISIIPNKQVGEKKAKYKLSKKPKKKIAVKK